MLDPTDPITFALITVMNLAIVWGLQVVYSYHVNPRRLEGPVYGVWTNIFAILLHDYLDVLTINPQLNIYISPNQENLDPNASFNSQRTIPDSEARGVVTDIAITYVTPVPRTGSFISEIISRYDFQLFSQQQISQESFHGAWFAPILVELKSSPIRHIVDLEAFMISRNQRMDSAMDQVIEQALCLFSSPKYGFQQEIFLIAGTGEWWAFTIMRRGQARSCMELMQAHWLFSLTEYHKNCHDRDAFDEDDATTEDVATCDILEAETQGSVMIQAAGISAARASREYANRERDRRAQRRARDRETAHINRQELIDFVQKVPKNGQFQDEDIDEFERLEAKSSGLSTREFWPEPMDLRALAEAAISSSPKPKFTRPVRFGSQRSNNYFLFLKTEMERIVKAERNRRGYSM